MSDAGFLDILGVRFRVMEREEASWPSGQHGLCDHTKAQITLSDALVPDMRRNTLIHEVVHAIAELVGEELTETSVAALATGLASIPQLRIEMETRGGILLPGDT